MSSKASQTADWKPVFLEHFARTGVILHAARAAGITRNTVHRHRKDDPEFARAFDEALDDAIDTLEEEARRRAADGVEKLVLHAGEVVRHPETGEPLVERVYSDTLMVTLLKSHRPERFRDSHKLEHTGPGGGPVNFAMLAELADDDGPDGQDHAV